MQPRNAESPGPTTSRMPGPDGGGSGANLRLTVRNHPGAMSHVCGLFSRRAFNVERIACVPIGDGTRSAILLGLNETARIEQLIRQLRKLEDVLAVEVEPRAASVFASIAERILPPDETSSPP